MLNIKKTASILPVIAILAVTTGVTSTIISAPVEAATKVQTLAKSGACNTRLFHLVKTKTVLKTKNKSKALKTYNKFKKINPKKTCTVLKKKYQTFLVTKSFSIPKKK